MIDFFNTTQGSVLFGAMIGAGSFALGSMSHEIVKLATLFKTRHHTLKSRNLAMLTLLSLDDYVGAAYAAALDRPIFNPVDPFEFAFDLPDPALKLPKDVDWHLLGFDLGDQIMWFSNRVANHEYALQSLDLTRDDYDNFFERRMEGYARLAARAIDLIAWIGSEFDVKLPEKPSYYKQAEGITKLLHELDREVPSVTQAESSNPTNVTPLFPKSV